MSIQKKIMKNQLEDLRKDYLSMVEELKDFVRLALITKDTLNKLKEAGELNATGDRLSTVNAIDNALDSIIESYVQSDEKLDVTVEVENG